MSVTEQPAPAPTAGIDWARDDHAVSVTAPDGRERLRFSVTHSDSGLAALGRRLREAGVSDVAIERPDGPVVDVLLDAGLTVFVIPPGQLKNLRGRYGSAGNKDDRFDAYVLADAPRGATGSDGDARAHVTRALLTALRSIVEQIAALAQQIREQLALHPDAPIFTSLPRAGQVRAARLLAEIGDCRARFPTPESLVCLGGAAPSTRQSGKLRVVTFRWAVDKQLRDAVMDFAGDSRRASPWAAQLYDKHIRAGKTHQHATRILARSWLHVIWRCWQDGVPYDPARHNALQAALRQAA